MAAFPVDRCSVVSPKVAPGNWIAYFTEIGGRGHGRWLRALVCRSLDSYVLVVDEEGDVVAPSRWERVYQPPKLKPHVLREWLRAMTAYPAKGGPIA